MKTINFDQANPFSTKPTLEEREVELLELGDKLRRAKRRVSKLARLIDQRRKTRNKMKRAAEKKFIEQQSKLDNQLDAAAEAGNLELSK